MLLIFKWWLGAGQIGLKQRFFQPFPVNSSSPCLTPFQLCHTTSKTIWALLILLWFVLTCSFFLRIVHSHVILFSSVLPTLSCHPTLCGSLGRGRGEPANKSLEILLLRAEDQRRFGARIGPPFVERFEAFFEGSSAKWKWSKHICP